MRIAVIRSSPWALHVLCFLWLASIGLGSIGGAAAAAAAEPVLRNDAYTVHLHNDATFDVTNHHGDTRRFTPTFTVLLSATGPNAEVRGHRIERVRYNVLTWGRREVIEVDPDAHVEDGFDPVLDAAFGSGRTADLFAAAPRAAVTAVAAEVNGDAVQFTFDDHPAFQLSATLTVPPGRQPPVLAFAFQPRRDGWYSVGYTGAPAVDPAEAQQIWQPLIWNEKRFPNIAYLTMAFRATLPSALVAHADATVGVLAHPDEFPFMPLPTYQQNNPFGIAVRDVAGRARPTLFAPVLGVEKSRMQADDTFRFRMMLPVVRGGTTDAFLHLARSVYGFADVRRNVDISLNATLENMVDYGMSEWSRFNEELRGCDYSTDAPGAVKNVSSLHPLGVALVMDDEAIFFRRARPMIEFMLSREKFLFATSPAVRIQNPSWLLRGPAAPLSELAALYRISGGRTQAFAALGKDKFGVDHVYNLDEVTPGDRWQNALAMYRMTGEPAWRDRTIAEADAYLARRTSAPQTDFGDPDAPGMTFWPMWIPHWIDLLELYETTGRSRYLDAAAEAARAFTTFTWMAPRVPDEKVLVNQDGKAPRYFRRRGDLIDVAPERVEAWRLSEMGLTPESSHTSKGHRAILNAHHAPYMLRLAQLTGDDTFRDVARNAVIGRYTNFPGYHINTDRTTVFMKPDFPMRPQRQLNTTTSIHFNHIWPHIALLLDYLVADAQYRSEGAIRFPSHHAEGYAYLQTKVYGHAPGQFYDDKDVWLWMPPKLLDISDVQLNYIAARGNGKLYLAFTNQSDERVEAGVTINAELVPVRDGAAVQVREHGGDAVPHTLRDGTFRVSVPARGLAVAVVDGADVQPRFQHLMTDATPRGRWAGPVKLDFGGTTAAMLSFADTLTSAYVYVEATDRVLRDVTLHYDHGGGWQQVEDTSYPFEFTVPMPVGADHFRFYVTATRTNGAPARSEEAVLRREF